MEFRLFYFCFNHLAISAIIVFGNYHLSHFEWALSSGLQNTFNCPFAIQLILALLCADFVLYWEHRLYHEVYGQSMPFIIQ